MEPRVAPRRRRLWPVLALAGVAAIPLIANDYVLSTLTLMGIYTIVLLGLDLAKGYAGLLSLGQAGFMGLAAYVSGILTVRYQWDPLAALGVAAAAVLLFALVMAVPGARLTGFNLALATLGFGIIMEGLFLGLRSWTGGAAGITGVPRFSVGGLVFRTEAENFWLIWFLAAVAFLLSHNLVNSRFGRALRAIRQNELAAAMLGIDVASAKVQVFVLAALYSAVAGSLFAHYTRFIAPEMVSWSVSTSLLSMLVLGGEGSLWGVLLGVAVMRLVPEIFNGLQDYLMILQGLILVALMTRLPDGLFGLIRAIAGRARRGPAPAAAAASATDAGNAVAAPAEGVLPEERMSS